MPNPSPLAWIVSLIVVCLLSAGVYLVGSCAPLEAEARAAQES
jgi:hypothetical protein